MWPWSESWSWSITLIVSAWLIRLIMLIVVTSRKRRPITCLAWLTIIYFQPWAGLILYLLIGENRLGASRVRRYALQARPLADPATRPAFLNAYLHIPVDEPQQIVARVLDAAGGLPIVSGNQISLMPDSDAYIDRLVADIDGASRHVHLLYYIFAHDDVGRRVAEAVRRAGERGVRCRLLADAVGSRRLFRRYRPGWKPAGPNITVAPALPANILRRRLARLDLRNHRKLAVIDGRTAYTGSQNIVRPDYGFAPHTHIGPWRDISARIAGPSVALFQAVFLRDWAFATGESLDDAALYAAPEPSQVVDGGVILQPVPSGPTDATLVLEDVVVEILHAARRRAVITSPYFIPDDALLTAFRLAVTRGVRVDLVLPRRSNALITDTAGRFYYSQLLHAGVRIHLHDRGLLHAKTLTVDDRLGMFGSANFDVRSFQLNFELNTLIYDARTIAELRALQEAYIGESRELTPEAWDARSETRRLLENLAKLLSPLL